MLLKKIPAPVRVDYVASPYEPDEDGVQDVGYYIGRLSDGRAYRMECWRMGEMLMATVLFSDCGLEAYCRSDMFLLLEVENILHFTGSKRSLQCARTLDDRDQNVWALNIMLQNSKGEYGKLLVKLNKYK